MQAQGTFGPAPTAFYALRQHVGGRARLLDRHRHEQPAAHLQPHGRWNPRLTPGHADGLAQPNPSDSRSGFGVIRCCEAGRQTSEAAHTRR